MKTCDKLRHADAGRGGFRRRRSCQRPLRPLRPGPPPRADVWSVSPSSNRNWARRTSCLEILQGEPAADPRRSTASPTLSSPSRRRTPTSSSLTPAGATAPPIDAVQAIATGWRQPGSHGRHHAATGKRAGVRSLQCDGLEAVHQRVRSCQLSMKSPMPNVMRT